ncbi:polysaccharide biosynthesis protein [Sulfolobales archaeon HS-7]|nr:polysaccharide biosynthesis protein [Sulfolobales archaeon HS-7]
MEIRIPELKLLIIASGGGHTGFARAIAQYLPFKADFVIPCNDSTSKKMIEPYADKLVCVTKLRMPNESSLVMIPRTFTALSQSISLDSYQTVVSTGSNHSLLPSLVARIRGSEIFVIESQDRFLTRGKTVYLLSRVSKEVLLHWKEQESLYPSKGVHVGPIVERPKYQPRDQGYYLITTGSMGFPRLVRRALRLNYDFVIQDATDLEELKGHPNYFKFDPDLEKWIANATAVITHQGKTAMEAVVMYRKPTLVVYNKDWKSATTFRDSMKYAEVLGAGFLPDPVDWKDDELDKALKQLSTPKEIEPGTQNAVKRITSQNSTSQ